MPKALYCGAADLALAKVGGLDAPGSNMTQKIRSYHTHQSKLFRGGYAVLGHVGHRKGEAKGREVSRLKKQL